MVKIQADWHTFFIRNLLIRSSMPVYRSGSRMDAIKWHWAAAFFRTGCFFPRGGVDGGKSHINIVFNCRFSLFGANVCERNPCSKNRWNQGKQQEIAGKCTSTNRLFHPLFSKCVLVASIWCEMSTRHNGKKIPSDRKIARYLFFDYSASFGGSLANDNSRLHIPRRKRVQVLAIRWSRLQSLSPLCSLLFEPFRSVFSHFYYSFSEHFSVPRSNRHTSLGTLCSPL